MSPSLPKYPSLGQLEKSAELLLAAQRQGHAQCCPFLRRLQRFAEANDADILTADVTLQDALQVVALHFDFESWDMLRQFVQAPGTTNALSLEATVRQSSHEIPDYAGPGVPLAVTAALNHAGVEIDYMEFAAASGWAFSFAYRYDDIWPAHMAVRGDPAGDGPFEVFAFLPDRFGFGYDFVLTTDHESLWRFVQKHVDAGTPIMSEHLDGGLLTGYREDDGKRRLYFDGTVGAGWIGVDDLQPHAVYVLEKQRAPLPPARLTRQALRRAVQKGAPHVWRDTPQGLSGLKAYMADVANPDKDFCETEEWFCWAALERLMARRCCEVWLRSVAEQLSGSVSDLLLLAAQHYGRAYNHYDAYRALLADSERSSLSLNERARMPPRIAELMPHLEQGIAAEAAGLDVLERVVETLPPGSGLAPVS